MTRSVSQRGKKAVRGSNRAAWFGASLMAQKVKNPPARQETQVLTLGWEDPLGKEMATHSSILIWGIPWTEESGGLQSMRLQRAGCNNNNCSLNTNHGRYYVKCFTCAIC